jgi:hypothetical protein
MFDVWVIDFVSSERRLLRSELSWKQARKCVKKLNKSDPFSLAVVVPLGFSLA